MKKGTPSRNLGLDLFREGMVSNIENFKRRRALHPFGMLDLSSRLFFERALHVKRGEEFIFFTNADSKDR